MNKQNDTVMVRIKKSLKKELKILAAHRDKTIGQIIEELYNESKSSKM